MSDWRCGVRGISWRVNRGMEPEVGHDILSVPKVSSPAER